ncbi:type IV pilus biogenesis/stability protein PilW [Aromatoleum toluclasticum]|uniref:type IV pilus biogenesis/stability protein PilW n=1 Tax=Aromatoleum toluclasticum TaxID=92003 RepID=UPI00037E5ECE|nr:type IV pilus biogenesis/stability protein PilW [Aromatoleum toluclasticum]MCC4115153.1 type IV pilus biogenesis/stability protein PilW [Aromatoleum toluclasticum]
MTRLFVKLSLPLLVLALAGCNATMNAAGTPLADRPVADTPVSGKGEATAKVHAELGAAYLQLGNYAVALDEARVALQSQSSYAPAYHLIGLVYMAIDDPNSARENFRRALEIAPNDPEFNNSFGWFQCLNGNPQDGLARLASSARNPYYRTPTRPYTNAGLCHLRQGDDAAAEAEFRRAVQADPANRQAIYQLAGIAYRRGVYNVASALLVDLHQQGEPTPQSVWLGLRTARRLGNRDAEASYAAQLRGRFADSPEYQTMIQGNYE